MKMWKGLRMQINFVPLEINSCPVLVSQIRSDPIRMEVMVLLFAQHGHKRFHSYFSFGAKSSSSSFPFRMSTALDCSSYSLWLSRLWEGGVYCVSKELMNFSILLMLSVIQFHEYSMMYNR